MSVSASRHRDARPDAPVLALAPNPTVRFRIDTGTVTRGEGGPGNSPTDGRNPPRGVVFRYFLKEKPAGPVKITNRY